MHKGPGDPGARRASRAGVSARLSLGQVFVDGDGDSFPVSSQQTAQRDPSRRSIAFAMSAIRLVDAGDAAGFESLVSGMSSSQRALVFSTGGASGSIGGDRSLVLVAVRRGELSLLQAVLRWIPQGKEAKVLMSKNDQDGQTVLMLAAASGDTGVFKAVASKLPRAQMLEHLSLQCVRGNSVFAYGVETGSAAMIEAVIDQFPWDEAVDALCAKNMMGETPLMHAARAPAPGAFMAVATFLPTVQLTNQLEVKTEEGQTALTIATRAGNVATWTAVASKMSTAEVTRQLSSTDIYGETAVMLSVRSGNKDMLLSVVGRLAEEQVLTQLGRRNEQGQTPAQVAVACGAETVLAAMIHPRWVAACMLDAPDESEAQLTALDLAARPPAKLNMLKCLLACGATPTARTVLSLVRNCGEGCGDSDGGRGRGLSLVQECFLGAVAASEWASNPLVPGLNLSVALIEARRQTPDFRTTLGELRTEVDALVISVLQHLPDTVAGFDRFSKNASAAAASQHRAQVLPENTKFTAGPSSRSRGVPVHTVGASLNSTIARGVPRKRPEVEESVSTAGVGVTLVQEMLEPELAGLRPRQCSGPLAQAVHFRHFEFICTPLVVDYLRLKFSAGLPNPFRETNWRREYGRMDRDLARFMLDADESKLRVYILQGGCADSPSWTYLPGLQFILAGLVGKTAAFYGVPAMRLALDVVIYVGVISVFVLKVVVLKDASIFTSWEVLWVIYLFGAIWQQVREVQEAGSIRMHFSNPWVLVETTMLISLSAAFVFRLWAFVCDRHGEWLCGELSTDVPSVSDFNVVYMAQYFQAASAPFVLGRMLFLTQIHSSLGPLMHSVFRMFTDLARFGALMLVIVLGFSLAFYALFGSTSATLPDGGLIAAYDTYYTSVLTLFGSMLGNFDFSVFDGAPMAEAGVVLLVFFLLVMNITLLNLLIAILSTAHGRVEGNADKEAVLSEALIITQYRRAMRSDSLPSPLNVPQELISYMCWNHKERSKELFARGVFWLISGPIAIAATTVLWAVSLPLTLTWAGRVLRSNGPSMLVPSVLGISFNLGVAPAVSTWLWLRGLVGVWQQGHGTMEVSDLNEIEASRAHRRRNSVGGQGSPLASIASAAVAANAGCTTVVTADAANDQNNPNGGAKRPVAAKSPSAMWKRAAGVYNGGRTASRRGFDVDAAVRAECGLTIRQLKERLGNRVEEVEVQQQDDALAKTLAAVQKGHDRLEERVRKANETTIRIEAKLEEFIGILHNNYGENIDDNETNPTIRQQKAIAAASGASGSLVVEEERKRVESTREKPAGRGQDDNESRRSSSGEPIDEFIHDYH